MKPLRVLILEDNPTDLELILYHLHEAGFEAIWQPAINETEFLTGLEQPLDLILADYQLPGYDGLQALQAVKARQLDIPFILVSGVVGEEAAIEVMKAGAADYLLKHRLMRLGSAVDQALAGWAHRQQKQQFEHLFDNKAESYQWLVESLPQGIVAMEAGKLIYINPMGAKLFGVPEPDMLLGKAFSDLVHPANLVAFEQQLAQLEAKENICWLEGVFTRLDGQVIDLEIAATHLTNRNRTTIQMILRDVTEQKRAEAERQLTNLTLAESEAQFRATFEQAAVGISWQHPDGRFLQVNQKFCDITGYTPQALLDLSVHDLIHPDDLDKSNLYHRRLWSDEIQSFHGISRYRHKHGHPIWLNITGSLARNPNRLPLYLINIIQDINEFMDQLPYSDPQDQDKSSEPRL